jgi:predicted Zn-ribbon and HTH transcriptional regulator
MECPSCHSTNMQKVTFGTPGETIFLTSAIQTQPGHYDQTGRVIAVDAFRCSNCGFLSMKTVK